MKDPEPEPESEPEKEGSLVTFASLFSGAGGFDIGLERAGMTCVYQCEWDKERQEVLKRHWPDVPKGSDIKDVTAEQIPPADVWCWGSPCQDLSVAGQRAGLDEGGKSSHFHDGIRLIRESRERCGKPDISIWENVPGALSSRQGEDFLAVIEAFIELGAMDVCWRVLDSQFFGVPQRRRRVFVVADFSAMRAKEILFEPASSYRDHAPRKSKRKGSTRKAVDRAQVGDIFTIDNEVNANVGIAGTLQSGSENSGTRMQLVAFEEDEGKSPAVGFDPKHGDVAGDDLAPTLRAHSHPNSNACGSGGMGVVTSEEPSEEPSLVRMRSGKHHGNLGGGKGALVSNGVSLALATGNDMTLFVPETEPEADDTLAFYSTGGSHGSSHIEGSTPPLKVGSGTGASPVAIAVRTAQTSANGHGIADDVAHTLDGANGQAVMAVDTTQITSPLNYSNPMPGDPCHPLAATAHPPLIVASEAPEVSAVQNTGHGWWNESDVGTTLRTPQGGGSMEANLIVEPEVEEHRVTTSAFLAGSSAKTRSIGLEEEMSPTLTSIPNGSTAVPTVFVDDGSDPLLFQARFARNGRGEPSAEGVVDALRASAGVGDSAQLVAMDDLGADDVSPVAFYTTTGGHDTSGLGDLSPSLKVRGVSVATVEDGPEREGDIANTVTASMRDYGYRADGSDNLIVAADISPTLSGSGAGTARTGNERTESEMIVATPDGPKMVVRRLMPVETERLQAWPDDHTAYRSDGSEISDTARYGMTGDGVTSSVAEFIARRAKAAILKTRGTQG